MWKYSPSTKGFYDQDFPADKMPSDVIDVSDEAHEDLINQQSTGKIIDFDAELNLPVAKDAPSISTDQQVKNDILVIESTITPRRIREAILGTDKGWLANAESQIDALRKKLK